LNSGVEAADHARTAALLQMAPHGRPLMARKAQTRHLW
jgi:hypothetical protein